MKEVFVYRCFDRGPEHLNQNVCGNFYTETDYDGSTPYCPNCGRFEHVRLIQEAVITYDRPQQ